MLTSLLLRLWPTFLQYVWLYGLLHIKLLIHGTLHGKKNLAKLLLPCKLDVEVIQMASAVLFNSTTFGRHFDIRLRVASYSILHCHNQLCRMAGNVHRDNREFPIHYVRYYGYVWRPKH